MVIGIFTFHRAENVGAVLQSWALQQYLCSLGHQVKIIDYRCKSIELDYDIWHPRLLWNRRNIFKSFCQYIGRIRRCGIRSEKSMLFAKFRNENLKMSRSVNRVSEIPLYDVYITGSDQVWNMALTKGYNIFYFLDFSAQRKIAYAVSTEKKSFHAISKKNKEKIVKALNCFNAISVREGWIKSELSTFVPNIDIELCIDPVFLLPKEWYERISVSPNEKEYVFVYQVVESPLCKIVAESLASKYNLKIVYMHASQETQEREHLYTFGPSEFLGYVSNAKYVITTSFHGVAFSLIFQKDFWVVDSSLSNRQKNILNLLDLNYRLISSDNVSTDSTINYDNVNRKLRIHIDKSKAFLVNNIK